MNAKKPSKLSPFSAIIFDLDGLVLDTETTFIRAWKQAAEQMSFNFPESFYESLSGLDGKTVMEKLSQYAGSDFDLSYFQQLSGTCWHQSVQQYGIPKKKGFDELLSVIQQQKIPFCLATNSHEKNARECLAFANLDNTFDIIISAEHVKHAKPHPDIFLHTAARLQQPIAHCLVLEDSFTGIQAAAAAGAQNVLIPSILPVYPQLLALSDHVFTHLGEVAKIMSANFP